MIWLALALCALTTGWLYYMWCRAEKRQLECGRIIRELRSELVKARQDEADSNDFIRNVLMLGLDPMPGKEARNARYEN